MAVQVRLEETPLNPTLNVALCGSFRRDWQGLVSTFETLRDLGLNVVSPIELDFVSESHGFVYTRTSDGATPGDIEALSRSGFDGDSRGWFSRRGCG